MIYHHQRLFKHSRTYTTAILMKEAFRSSTLSQRKEKDTNANSNGIL